MEHKRGKSDCKPEIYVTVQHNEDYAGCSLSTTQQPQVDPAN